MAFVERLPLSDVTVPKHLCSLVEVLLQGKPCMPTCVLLRTAGRYWLSRRNRACRQTQDC